jgi:hypothetical protein
MAYHGDIQGHASVAITLDTYSHVFKGMQEKAASLFDTIMIEAKRYRPRVLMIGQTSRCLCRRD